MSERNCWREMEAWLLRGIPPSDQAWEEVTVRMRATANILAAKLGVVNGKCWEDPVQETFLDMLMPKRVRWNPAKGSVDSFIYGILRKKLSTHLFRPYPITLKRAVPLDENCAENEAQTEKDCDPDDEVDVDLTTLLPGVESDPEAMKLLEAAKTVDIREADIQISLATGISRWKVRQLMKMTTGAPEENDHPDVRAVFEAAKTIDSRRVDEQLVAKTGFTKPRVQAIKRRIRRRFAKQLRKRGKLRTRNDGC